MSNEQSGQATTDTATTQASTATQVADTTTAQASATTAAAGTTTETPAATTQPTGTETPAAETKPAEGETKPAESEAKPAGAPEKYEFKFSETEGRPTDGTLKAFEETARSLDMPNEAAQTVLDKVIPAMRAEARASLEAFYRDIGGMPETWADQVKADKDIGGTKFDDTMAVAAKARDAFGGPELTNLLNKTGLGNHPALIKAFAKAGRAISADRFVDGRAATSDTRSAAEKLYGKN